MRAVRLYGRKDLRVDNVSEPQISNEELLVRVKAAFVCGTDLRMYDHGRPADDGALTLGHEMSGTIEQVGSALKGSYREGQRVAVAPNMGCGICDRCVSGNTQMCNSLSALGINLDGGFAEYLRVPAAAVRQGNVALLPDLVSFEEGALAEPFSCVYNAFERLGAIPGRTVLVIGAGPIGLMHAKLHLSAGAGMVMIHDLNAERLAACKREEPAFVTIGSSRVKDEVFELTHGEGADVVITAAPSPAAQVLAFEVAAIDARVMFFGGLPKEKEQVLLNTNIVHYRQITVTGTTRQNIRQYRASLDLVARKKIDLSKIVTHTYSLEEAAEAFDVTRAGKALKAGFVL